MPFAAHKKARCSHLDALTKGYRLYLEHCRHSETEPVLDLTQDDFELKEDGALQTIKTFEHVQITPGVTSGRREPSTVAESNAAASDPRRRTFVNPQSGLYDRIASVKALANDVPVEGRIVFTKRAKFPKGLPRFTVMLDSVAAEFPKLGAAEPDQHPGPGPVQHRPWPGGCVVTATISAPTDLWDRQTIHASRRRELVLVAVVAFALIAALAGGLWLFGDRNFAIGCLLSFVLGFGLFVVEAFTVAGQPVRPSSVPTLRSSWIGSTVILDAGGVDCCCGFSAVAGRHAARAATRKTTTEKIFHSQPSTLFFSVRPLVLACPHRV